MHAHAGDWLLEKDRSGGGHIRRGLIIEVRSPEGAPPYLVRWVDDERESLVFPSPDSQLTSPARLAEMDRLERQRLARMQAAIAGNHRRD